MENALTRQDLDVLIEAVEAWENKDFGGEIMEAMITSAISKPENRAQLEAESEIRRRKRDGERRTRKDRSIMLRAKLIALRDSSDAEALLESSR